MAMVRFSSTLVVFVNLLLLVPIVLLCFRVYQQCDLAKAVLSLQDCDVRFFGDVTVMQVFDTSTASFAQEIGMAYLCSRARHLVQLVQS